MLFLSKAWSKMVNKKKERLFTVITYIFSAAFIICVCYLWRNCIGHFVSENKNFSLDLEKIPEKELSANDYSSRSHDENCRISSCVNIYRCDQGGQERLSVYVYPFLDFVDTLNGKVAFTITREFYEVLEAIVNSPFYTSNPNEACLLLPAVDLLNINLVDSQLVSRALASLDHWRGGENHILINLLAGNSPYNRSAFNINSSRAIILSGDFDVWSYRPGFDVAMPVWSPVLRDVDVSKLAIGSQRKYKLMVAQLNIVPESLLILRTLAQANPTEVIVLEKCNLSERNTRCVVAQPQLTYEYPRILKKGTFCLLSRSLHIGQPDLLEMLAYGCIPIIAVDSYVFPFAELIDWSLATLRIREIDLHLLLNKIRSVSETKTYELQQHGNMLYNQYFKDLRSITLTALSLLQSRIFPHLERKSTDWNSVESTYQTALNPLFLPMTVPKAQGFTAVILTYDRVKSLFTLIQKLALAPSLHSILVVWNNPQKPAPHFSTFPIIQKPLKIVRMRANLLSNRFFPYAEIETEAILSIDDDITMLRADELDFGFEVWREFPDRIVGFPSRVHMWDNSTLRWYYDSEWTNHISMVLTGAAFHHKFWSHMYTYGMPGDIKKWVDNQMNCEDIAMNFLVAKITNKSPIKVTPRKKFKCPECTNNEMLSADLSHMLERSACVDRFAKIYGYMPLRTVEFRADPVLFKDNFPEKLKRFNDVGSL